VEQKKIISSVKKYDNTQRRGVAERSVKEMSRSCIRANKSWQN